jgi:serine/threonine-protein kinase
MSSGKLSSIAAILFTDIVGSVQLKEELGAVAYGSMLTEHDEAFNGLCQRIDGSLVKDTGDGFVATFPTVSAAVSTALRFQYALNQNAVSGKALRVRMGINVGEVVHLGQEASGQTKLVGRAMDLAARLMGMANENQILLSRTAFDEARQFLRAHPVEQMRDLQLLWLAHGAYLFKGLEEPVEVFEVGPESMAPCIAPANSEKARRAVAADEEAMLGWRPAAGLVVPRREGWVLTRKLGSGGDSEVWLGQHVRLRDQRVFKFCFGRERIRSLKREMTLFRLIKEALGDRPDICPVYEVHLDDPPFVLETGYTEGGNLSDWAEKLGDIEVVPLAVRLDIVARTAEAVAAAHSVGVLHKDIKPTNILIYRGEDGNPRPRLSDFGIGQLSDTALIRGGNITITGLTLTDNRSDRSGTLMYAPPELLAGRPYTIEGDIYSLGVLLYQLVVGDLSKPLAHGWEQDISDDLLREDVAACVAGDPSKRLTSATELARRLRSLDQRRASVRHKNELLERERAALQRAKKRYQRLGWLLLGIAVIGLVLVVLLILQF